MEELPLYEPAGTGRHLYVRLKRSGWNTQDLARELGGLFHLKETDVGWAGLKDKDAVTIQTFSLNLENIHGDEAAGLIVGHLPVEILSVGRHKNKLKTGHLLGNRFSILLRETPPDAAVLAEAIAAAVRRRGLPNYYGPQRFGSEGDNAKRGREVLLGRGPRQKWLRRFLLSAFQADLFNQYAAQRVERGWFQLLKRGDVAKKLDTGGLFDVEDESAEQPRLDAGAITYTGPIFGRKMRRAGGEPGDLEQSLLDANEVTPDLLARARLDGSRRAVRLYPHELEIREHEHGLLFSFALPKGSYATTLLREFTREP